MSCTTLPLTFHYANVQSGKWHDVDAKALPVLHAVFVVSAISLYLSSESIMKVAPHHKKIHFEAQK